MGNFDLVRCDSYLFLILFHEFLWLKFAQVCFLALQVTSLFFDMLTRIRNANSVKSRTVVINRSNLAVNIARVLKKEGFIESFEEIGEVVLTEKGFVHRYISISLKYKGVKQKPYITGLKRISKPGLRVYVNQNSVPRVLGGIGIAVFARCYYLFVYLVVLS